MVFGPRKLASSEVEQGLMAVGDDILGGGGGWVLRLVEK